LSSRTPPTGPLLFFVIVVIVVVVVVSRFRSTFFQQPRIEADARFRRQVDPGIRYLAETVRRPRGPGVSCILKPQKFPPMLNCFPFWEPLAATRTARLLRASLARAREARNASAGLERDGEKLDGLLSSLLARENDPSRKDALDDAALASL